MISYIKKQLVENPTKEFEARNITARLTCDMSSSCVLGLDAKSFDSKNPEIFTLGWFMFQFIVISTICFHSRDKNVSRNR